MFFLSASHLATQPLADHEFLNLATVQLKKTPQKKYFCCFSGMRSEGFSFNSGGRALFATHGFYIRNRPQVFAVGR